MKVASLIVIITFILFSCSQEKEPNDFIGKYTFYKANRVVDYNKHAPKTGTLFKSHPRITYYLLSLVELEIFEGDENITGKMLFTGYSISKLTMATTYEKVHLQASKFRLSGDTLQFELINPNFQTFSYTTRLIKNDSGAYLGLDNDLVKVDESVNQLTNHYANTSGNYRYLKATTKDQKSMQTAFLAAQVQALKDEGQPENSDDIRFLKHQIDELAN